MSKKRQEQRLDTIAFHSATPAIEASFTAAARDVFGELQVHRLEADAEPQASALGRALLVIAHAETAQNVADAARAARSGDRRAGAAGDADQRRGLRSRPGRARAGRGVSRRGFRARRPRELRARPASRTCSPRRRASRSSSGSGAGGRGRRRRRRRGLRGGRRRRPQPGHDARVARRRGVGAAPEHRGGAAEPAQAGGGAGQDGAHRAAPSRGAQEAAGARRRRA